MTREEVFAAMTMMQYWLNGERIQVSGPCGFWVDVADNEFPSWDWSSYRWRVKPHTDVPRGCDCCDPTSPSPDPVSRDWLCDPPHSYLRGFKAMKRPCLVLLWKKRATHWVCLYRMLIPINDCRGKLIRVPLGETKVTPGDSTWNPLRGPDEGMALNTPFRDGAHIRWDARKLLMPAYVIYGKVCDVVRDCITHEELR